MKKVEMKRVFVWAFYNHLRQVPPKDFPNTGEIKATISDILPALRPHVDGYLAILKRAEELQTKITDKEIKAEDSEPLLTEINEEWKKNNRDNGNEIVTVELSDDGFDKLKEQLNREDWGKKWIATLEEFGELLAAFDAAK